MSEVTRYDIKGDETDFVPHSDGEWVSYRDYAALVAERDAALAGARDNADWARNAEHEMREAKAELAALAHEMRGVRAVEKWLHEDDDNRVVQGSHCEVGQLALYDASDEERDPFVASAASLPALGHALLQGGCVDGE